MNLNQGRTIEMLANDIIWNEVAEELGISRNTLYVWRNGEDKNKKEAVKNAIKNLVSRRKKVKK